MRYNQLGNTGLYVSKICPGTMTFGGRDFWKIAGNLEQPVANKLIGRALEAGVNFLHTAVVFSEGRSEQMVGQVFKDLGLKRSDTVLATKCSGRLGRGVNNIDANTEEQLNDKLAAGELELAQREITRLDEVNALPAEYPGWMPARQSAERVPGQC